MKIKITQQQIFEAICEALGGNNHNILYIALVLDETSSFLLRKFAYSKIKGNEKNYRLICHHMTLVFNNGNMDENIVNWAFEHEGEEFELVAKKCGISDKSLGVMVKTAVPSANKIKHVTLAVNTENGGKPVDTNYITEWTDIQPIYLKGRIKIFWKR